MKRNPIEHAMKQYYNSIRFKKIKPRFFFKRCNKCSNEFKKETMFKCDFEDDYFENVTHCVYGCNECFSSIKDFKNYCYKHIILPKDAWFFDGKPCLPILTRTKTTSDRK